jgi:hypothetical protein
MIVTPSHNATQVRNLYLSTTDRGGQEKKVNLQQTGNGYVVQFVGGSVPAETFSS